MPLSPNRPRAVCAPREFPPLGTPASGKILPETSRSGSESLERFRFTKVDQLGEALFLSLYELSVQCDPSPWHAESLRDAIRENGGMLYGLIEKQSGNCVTGFALVQMIFNEAQILKFGVSPNERRKGLGEHLLRETLNDLNCRGVERVWLEVRVSNQPAIGLYQKLGFTKVGRRPQYYRDNGEDALVMQAGLGPSAVGK